MRAWGAASILSLFLTACATGGARTVHYGDPSGSLSYVEVENNNWADVNVFVVRYGDWQRLGTVTSMTTARLRLPAGWVDWAERVTIRVEAIGSREAFTTREVPLERGAVFRVSVTNDLRYSTLVIR